MKGIEWIKLATCTCEDEKMRIIDSLEEYRDPGFYVWIRLLLQAGKSNDNGLIYLKEDVPYTNEMLSILFNRSIEVIEKVLKIFETFGMIEIYDNNIIKICNWEKHQNIEGMKRVREKNTERVRNFREKKKKENEINYNKAKEDEQKDNKAKENRKQNLSEILGSCDKDRGLSDKISDDKNCNADVTLKRENREKDNKNKIKKLEEEEKRVKEESKEEVIIKIQDSALDNPNDEVKDGIKTQDVDLNNHNVQVKEVSVSKSHGKEEIRLQGLKLINALEETKVKIKGLTLNWAMEALTVHQEEYVKMAISKAMKKNKADAHYISGILNNWLREGYPETCEESEDKRSKNNNLTARKEKPKLRFNNFESRQYDYEDLEKRLLGWKD